MQAAIRQTLCTLTLFAVVCVTTTRDLRADILDGLGTIGDSGNGALPGHPVVMMHDLRGLNFGPSYSYVHGTVNATATSVLAPGGQISQLAAQAQSGDVTLALMSIGDNDWLGVAADVATGALAGGAANLSDQSR